jgi:glycosyltransferase involved in cell wall biosynthesis
MRSRAPRGAAWRHQESIHAGAQYGWPAAVANASHAARYGRSDSTPSTISPSIDMDSSTIAPPVAVSFVASHGRLGGAERYLELLLEGLGPDWARSTVCLGEGPFVDRLRRLGHPVLVVRTPRRIGMLAAAWKLRRHLRRRQPDVVHANGTKAALVCGLATMATGIPVIWVKHDHFRDGWLTTLIALRCRQVVGVSAAVNAAFPRMLRKRLHVVYNGVPDLPVDREAGRALVAGLLGCGPDTPVVLLVGRLDPLKGAGELLQAAPQVLRHRPDVRFALLGGAESHHPGYRRFLEKRAEDLGIRESLAFLDHRDDAVEVLSGCDVVVIPSIPGPHGFGREGFPLVAIEALWVGTPIAGYADGGLPEAVADCARLVPTGDRSALAESILEILENRAMRGQLVARGMKRARARYRFASVVERMAERYRAAVRNDTSTA